MLQQTRGRGVGGSWAAAVYRRQACLLTDSGVGGTTVNQAGRVWGECEEAGRTGADSAAVHHTHPTTPKTHNHKHSQH